MKSAQQGRSLLIEHTYNIKFILNLFPAIFKRIPITIGKKATKIIAEMLKVRSSLFKRIHESYHLS